MKRRVYIGGFKEFTRMPLPQTGIFIAHDFSGRSKEDDKRDAPRQVRDYRFAYEDGLRDAGYTPVYAPVHSGTILETLVKEMINTDAGIFDVSFGRKYNANVLIELGISLGLNHPTVVVAETADKPLLDFLEVLNPFYYGDDDDLADEIGDVVRERIEVFDKQLKPYYCVTCQQESCSCRKNLHTQERSYLLLGADSDQSEHKRLRRNMKQVAREFNMTPLDPSTDHDTQLCGWLHTIKRSKLVLLYSQELGNRHHGSENALTMVQLGLCIGSNVRWRFVIAENENPPTDIVNYIDIRLSGGIELDRENIAGAIGALNSETDPHQGTFDVLEPREHIDKEEHSIDDLPLDNNSDYIFVGYPNDEGQTSLKILRVLEQIPIRAWNSIRDYQSADFPMVDKWRETKISEITGMILLIGESSIASRSITEELAIAIDLEKPIVIILMPNTPVEVLNEIASMYEELVSLPILRLESTDEELLEQQVTNAIEIIQSGEIPEIYLFDFPLNEDDWITSQDLQEKSGYVFIAYSRADKEITDRIREDLKRNNIEAWIDKESLTPGTYNWERSLRDAIHYADAVVLIATPNSRNSHYVKDELELAQLYNRPLIPVWADGDEWLESIGFGLGHIQYVDVRGDNYVSNFPMLINALHERLREIEPVQKIVDNEEVGTSGHVFMAYSRVNLDIALKLRQDLQDAAIKVWVDYVGLMPGTRLGTGTA